MGVMIWLIYVGGLSVSPDSWGFWKTVFWPYQIGKRLGRWAAGGRA